MSINREIWQSRLPLSKIAAVCAALTILFGAAHACDNVRVGAERTEVYLPLLEGKRVGVVANHTAMVGRSHLVDTLRSLGVDIRAVFAPEHGFRGDADAGESVNGYIDKKTGIRVVSIYGANKKPSAKDIVPLDIVVFDIQDVGMRYYTYLSSMHYVMESCAESGVPIVVLDRPNPNGMYVDGPVLDMKYRSFVGMHPIPVVHGMTLGELAGMINGEGWLEGGAKCDLTVVTCEGYNHRTRYVLPVKPSPNLPNLRSIYLYASLCFFEATTFSIGRGTDFPFQVYGHPKMADKGFRFTPRSVEGAKNPPHKDAVCYGTDLRTIPDDEAVIANGVDLAYLIDAYKNRVPSEKFFVSNLFEKLVGAAYVREMIVEGCSADEIKEMWKGDVEKFKRQRKPYLLYEE